MHTWRRSSHSGQNGSCVEVAFGEDAVRVRDSKNPGAGVLRVAPAAWSAFLGALGQREPSGLSIM